MRRRNNKYTPSSILRDAGSNPGEVGSNLWYWLKRKVPALSQSRRSGPSHPMAELGADSVPVPVCHAASLLIGVLVGLLVAQSLGGSVSLRRHLEPHQHRLRSQLGRASHSVAADQRTCEYPPGLCQPVVEGCRVDRVVDAIDFAVERVASYARAARARLYSPGDPDRPPHALLPAQGPAGLQASGLRALRAPGRVLAQAQSPLRTRLAQAHRAQSHAQATLRRRQQLAEEQRGRREDLCQCGEGAEECGAQQWPQILLCDQPRTHACRARSAPRHAC